MEPISGSAIAGIIAAISGAIGLANMLFRPDERTKQGWTWPGPNVPAGTKLRLVFDSIDDELRATFNRAPLVVKAVRGQTVTEEITVVKGKNEILAVVRNSGSGPWSFRLNMFDDARHTQFFTMPKPWGGNDNFLPGDKISNYLMTWEFTGV